MISSPSGGGKTTVIKNILKKGGPIFQYSVSVTTRPRRKGEINGKDYFFVTEEEFIRKIKGRMLIEWEEVHGNYYGTPKDMINKWLQQAKTIIMDIDVKGALHIRKQYPFHSLLIFIKPPSIGVLKQRLLKRAKDVPSVIDKRLKAAEQELAMADQFDHIVINDDLETAVKSVWEIIHYSKD